MSCDNCHTGPEARERQYQAIKMEAKTYAITKQTPVVIYWDPVQGYQFIEESRSAGVFVRELISHYPDASA